MRFNALIGSCALAMALPAVAQNIDLSTLPARDSVQLTIYNAEDLTLVRESRRVTLRAGQNQLQFSWANTLIDPTSVALRLPTASRLELVDTTFPHERSQVLYWTVKADEATEAQVEITYFTSGISWSADYVGVVNETQRSMAFNGYVSITNSSGEDYRDASVRMVVGTINLVEQIRDLAQRGLIPVDLAGAVDNLSSLKDAPAAVKLELGKAMADDKVFGGAGELREIVKQGLSEYFLFTVPGTETVPNGWSKRLRLFNEQTVPFTVEYRYRPQEYGDQLARLLLVRNDSASSLGESPLPDGDVRLFRQVPAANGGAEGLSALAFLTTKYVPIGQEFELNLGRDAQVILERLVMRRWRDEFWFRSEANAKLFSPSKGDRIDPAYSMSGWNDGEARVERIRNYRNEPIRVAWRTGFDGDVLLRSSLGMTLFDFRTPEFATDIPGNTTRDLAYDAVMRRGSNATQDRVTLEGGA